VNPESNDNSDATNHDPDLRPVGAASEGLSPDDSTNDYDAAAPADLVQVDLVRIKPQRLSWSGKLAWAFVIGATVYMFSMVAHWQVTTKPKVGGDASSKDLMQIQLSGKALVGQRNFLQSQGQPIPENANTVPDQFDSGGYEQRLCYAILVNEVEGTDEALEYLDELEEKVEESELPLTESQTQMRDALTGMLQEYESGNFEPDVDPADKQLIESRLEWIGKLAFVPSEAPDAAARESVISQSNGIMIASVAGLLIGGFFGLVGLGLGVTFFAMLMTHKLKSRFTHRAYNHNVYIETFAIWMGLFFGSSIVLGWIGIKSPLTGMMIQPFIFFGSLVVLAWPVYRGISFEQVRADIGWKSDNSLMDTGVAVPTYLAILPFLIPGTILLTVLMNLVAGMHGANEFARPFMPSHPVQDYIISGGVPMILLVFLTACVAAPVVEETMFRGVLYRHLRDVSAGWARFTSVLFSALVNALIFASIHPQGIYGIPVLATLAVGFSLAREWRGSLISSMVMHFIHNFLITCVSLLIL